jgi:hypothetical protein
MAKTPTRAPVVARKILAAFLVAHGVAHFAGTTGALGVARRGGELPLLGGAWTAGGTAPLVVLAAAWAVVGFAYVVLSVPVWRGTPFSGPALLLVTCASTVLSTIGLWASAIGLAIDLVLLVLVSLSPQLAARW